MPVLRSLPGGYTVACIPAVMGAGLPGGNRGTIASWSRQAAARNTRFLRAQPRDGFDDGQPLACTLTLGRCPESSELWASMRNRFLRRVRRLGLIRLHWVVEWTRRGWPHLHCSVWLAEGVENGAERIVAAWLSVTEGYRTLERAQHVTPMHQAGGWLRYVGKHAARGVTHYQRSRNTLPAGWVTSGRMWGHRGEWCEPSSIDVPMSEAEFHQLRRLRRRLEVARARVRGDRHAERVATRMWRCGDERRSRVRGISAWSEHEGEELRLLASVGFDADRRNDLADRATLDRGVLRAITRGRVVRATAQPLNAPHARTLSASSSGGSRAGHASLGALVGLADGDGGDGTEPTAMLESPSATPLATLATTVREASKRAQRPLISSRIFGRGFFEPCESRACEPPRNRHFRASLAAVGSTLFTQRNRPRRC